MVAKVGFKLQALRRTAGVNYPLMRRILSSKGYYSPIHKEGIMFSSLTNLRRSPM